MARKQRKLKAPRGGAVNTLLEVSAGAGAVLIGAYVLSRVSHKATTRSRAERLEAMLRALSKEHGGAGSA